MDLNRLFERHFRLIYQVLDLVFYGKKQTRVQVILGRIGHIILLLFLIMDIMLEK